MPVIEVAAENAMPLETLRTAPGTAVRQLGRLLAVSPIADYAFLSDCEGHRAGGAERLGRVMCLPKMDGPSVFGAMLDRTAGWFRFGPDDVTAGRRRLPARGPWSSRPAGTAARADE